MTENNKYFHKMKISKDGNVDVDYLEGMETAKASFGGYSGRRFDNFEGNISVKSDYNRSDYEWFRAKTLHNGPIEQMILSQKAYEKVGMVRNIIDMMAEFTSQGVRIEHQHPKKQRLLQEWFDYVTGQFVSERLAHMLYRLGAAPIQTAFGTISFANEKKMSESQGQFGDVEYKPIKAEKREIPLKYTFIPPWNIEIIGGDLSLFIGKPFYAIKIPTTILSSLSQANKIKDDELRKEIKQVLAKIKPIVGKSGTFLYLDPKHFDIYFYKKDDWQAWATPMIGAILDDLILLERMRLADMSALDGAISNIRHWKVGIIDPSNPTNSIIPTKAGINRIRQILSMSVGGGTMDLVTGPEIDFKESNTQVHKFLGTQKYEATLNAIYDGLGIPPPLRSNNSGNATNNYISLKTLIERLQYGRNILTTFWNKQLEIVQKALGHKIPGKIVFDNMILSDEASEKKLLIELLDRDVIDATAVQRYFGFIPSLVKPKISKGVKDRENGAIPPKAGPFHSPEKDHELKKIALQSGEVAPSEVGVELKNRKEGEKPRIDRISEHKIKEQKSRPTSKPKVGKTGRPKNVTETKKRKKKPNFKPYTGRGYYNLLIWATNAYNSISEKLSPIILKTLNKKNFRQLTVAEFKDAEEFKFSVFAQLQPSSEITDVSIYAALEASRSNIVNILDRFNTLNNDFITSNNREPTTNEQRQLYIISYVEVKYEDFSEKGVLDIEVKQ